MKVTRTLHADVPPALAGVCKAMGFVRADIWRRYGALGTVGKNTNAIRKEISAASLYDGLFVDGTIRAETTKDIVNDVLLYKAAALVKVRQAIAARTKDTVERKRLFTALKSDQWLTDNFLHRQMLKFGAVLTRCSDAACQTGKGRNKLHALQKKHLKAGRIAKARRIVTCNLGRKKIDARKEKAQKSLRSIAFESAHAIVDKAAVVVSEDLSSPIASKVQWKKYNRRMSAWAKGVLAAALNVLARLDDAEITRFTPYREVRRILLERSPAPLSVNRLELGAQARQPSADKS